MKKIAIAGLALVAMSGSALAADIMYTPPPAPPPAPVLFDWSGPYAGIYVGGILPPGWIQAGGTVGYNFVGGALFGIEGQLGAVFLGGVILEADLNARVGAIVGAEDRGLLYGEAGVGLAAGVPYWTAGGGVEVGVGDSASVFVEGKYGQVFGGGFAGIVIQGGVNFHFGN